MKPLWNKNFSILTLGTIVSMLGNALAGFALGVLALDYTNSTFAFAIYMVIYNLPRLFMPMIAGTFLDRFSRVKVIYLLDFVSSLLYLIVFFGLITNFFNYFMLLGLAFTIGVIDSVYSVAYDSLYPTLISEGNFSKAYSISSMIYPIAALMTPLAAYIYNNIGIEVLFIFNAFSFLIAALFETQIKTDEAHVKTNIQHIDMTQFKQEYSQGLKYLLSEKGLLTITLFFFCSSLFQTSVSQTIEMPYFKAQGEYGLYVYSFVSAANVLGRFIGGMVQYRISIPNKYKFNIAMFVYTAICFLIGFLLYLPFPLMIVFNFSVGLLAVTSFNIRISSTQAYVPNDLRGRFNGLFQTITTLGMVIGQLGSGAIAEVMDSRLILLAANLITLILTFLIVYRNRHHVKRIYNQSV